MDDVISGLERLSALRERGALSELEFIALKEKLLSPLGVASPEDGVCSSAPEPEALPPTGLEFRPAWEATSLAGSQDVTYQPSAVPPVSPVGGVEITCPGCETCWELEPYEAALPTYVCEECGLTLPLGDEPEDEAEA